MGEQTTLKRSLGLWSIILLGLGYMTPMVVFDTFGIVAGTTSGGVPLAYLVALVAMLLTALSYGKMVQVMPSAGTAYSYTSKTINGHLGFMVGWASLLDYLLLPMVNALIFRIYMNSFFPEISVWIWITAYVILLTGLNIWSVKLASRFNSSLVFLQIIMVVFFAIIAVVKLHNGHGNGVIFSIEPFIHSGIHFQTLMMGATVVCFSFLGFDAVTTFSEETPNPKKTIPKAIILTTLFGGALFIVASYFAQSLYPHLSTFKNTDDTLPEIAKYSAGVTFQVFFFAAAFAGVLSSGLASHGSVSRLLYVMGRDGVLPRKAFGYVHPRFRTPMFNVILVGLVTFASMSFSLDLISSFINYGALTAFSFVNLSVIAHYLFKEKRFKTPKEIINYAILPLGGFAFIVMLWTSLSHDSIYFGLIWSAIGFIYLLWQTRLFKVQPKQFDFELAEDTVELKAQ
ncbi:APC family permease [Terrilactibacillus laevilacticus]|uniref:APC family permease n=1 Tax=Terrilactibacillus laevilacticus TaxID=1380157 RepID=A0ABW5PPH2_9BACI|nr:APC family permease [Terrilactibacillus laevilacticus]